MWLKEQYLRKSKKVIDIAKQCNIATKTVNYWLRKFRFPRRKHSGKKGPRENTSNDKNCNWKGSNTGYHSLHSWVRRHKPKPGNCELCEKKTDKLELGNISGEYKRDLEDYMYICHMCHMKYDNRWARFTKASIKTRFKKGHKNELRWRKN